MNEGSPVGANIDGSPVGEVSPAHTDNDSCLVGAGDFPLISGCKQLIQFSIGRFVWLLWLVVGERALMCSIRYNSLPNQAVVCVELCSIEQIKQDMRSGCDSWLMLVQPTSHMVAVEADTCAGAGEGSRQLPEAFPWNDLVAEFANVFEPPGMPE